MRRLARLVDGLDPSHCSGTAIRLTASAESPRASLFCVYAVFRCYLLARLALSIQRFLHTAPWNFGAG